MEGIEIRIRVARANGMLGATPSAEVDVIVGQVREGWATSVDRMVTNATSCAQVLAQNLGYDIKRTTVVQEGKNDGK